MESELSGGVPTEDMNDTYVAHLRRMRWLMLTGCALVFGTIVIIELLSSFHASFVYLFVLALTVLVFLFASDAISSRIDTHEAEQAWRAMEGTDVQD